MNSTKKPTRQSGPEKRPVPRLTTTQIDAILLAASERVRKEQPIQPAAQYTSGLTLRTVFGHPEDP